MKMKTPQNDKARNERGFTLIETTIASVVMMVGALAISSLFLFSTQNNVGGGERALAMAVAQQQLEQIRSVTYGDATLTAGTTTQTLRNGNRNYTVQTTVADEINPDDNTAKNLKRVTVIVTPQTAGPIWMRTPVQLVTLRSTLTSGNWAVAQ
jgi:Tfp pilus assembly protein PilV